MQYDIVIIGAGSAGIAAAIRANEIGAHCLLVNSGLPIGGTCVNVGCVPSKAMIASAEMRHLAKRQRPGIALSVERFEFADVSRSVERLVRKIRKERYERVLDGLERAAFRPGAAKFFGPNVVDVDGERVEAERVIVCTGSTATVPRIHGLHEAGYITHVEALSLRRLPASIAVIGAGPLGLEFAQMFARFGVQVTLLEQGTSVLPAAEPVLVDRLVEIFEDEGIRIHVGVTVEEVSRDGADKVVRFSVGGGYSDVRAQEIMLAAGKTANTASLGLEQVGVETDERGSVRVDETLRTSSERMWAAGDVAALPRRLETTAAREGSLATGNALTGSEETIVYHEVPYAVFTDPQLASVGYTEAEHDRDVGPCLCRTVFLTTLPKAQILDRREGLIKMVLDREDNTVRGVHVLAPNAADIIAQAMTLVSERVPVEKVVSSYPVFPTLSEAIKYVALAFTRDVQDMPCCI